MQAVPGGREVRTTNLRAVEVDNWIEAIVALTAGEIVAQTAAGVESVVRVPQDDEALKAARSTVRQARRAGRRKVTDDLLSRVAEVYRAEELRPAEAVGLAFGVAPRTAFRYIALARERGLLL